MNGHVTIIGGGLAGCEAEHQLARRGFNVSLYEMRPKVETDVHKTGNLAELVCSNSLRSDDPHHPVGLIKREMAAWDSLIIRAARKAALPAGSALAVDRDNLEQEFRRFNFAHMQHHAVVDALVASGSTMTG